MSNYLFTPPTKFDYSQNILRALLPKGVYRAKIIDTRLCENSNGSKSQLIQYEVLDGTHKGRTVSQKWFIDAKEDYQKANIDRNFSALAVACDYLSVFQLDDLTCLHGRELWIDISHTQGKDGKPYHRVSPTAALLAPVPAVAPEPDQKASSDDAFAKLVYARLALKRANITGSAN